jgi:hypothetical protein
MAEQVAAEADALAGEARRWRETYRAAEDALVAAARRGAAGLPPENPSTAGLPPENPGAAGLPSENPGAAGLSPEDLGLSLDGG